MAFPVVAFVIVDVVFLMVLPIGLLILRSPLGTVGLLAGMRKFRLPRRKSTAKEDPSFTQKGYPEPSVGAPSRAPETPFPQAPLTPTSQQLKQGPDVTALERAALKAGISLDVIRRWADDMKGKGSPEDSRRALHKILNDVEQAEKKQKKAS